MDKRGNLYGVLSSSGGGAQCPIVLYALICGTVFELTRNATLGAPWTLSDLYDFCTLPACADGEGPIGGLVMDQDGNLYGTTLSGGTGNRGTVFELVLDNNSKWSETVLHDFGRTDGSPVAPLIMDEEGNLFGETSPNSKAKDAVVFMLQP